MTTEIEKQVPTILIVDDVLDSLVMISLTLQSMGFRVLTAENGRNAIEVARLACPDLILMDIHMPELDGLAATRRLREQTELQKIPVVALTAFSTEGFQKAAFDAGLDGYLTKPVDFERLIKLINTLIDRE
ncbi:MAG: response regulator [Pyrinomonadaceae bacterium]|jgi:CheY-like chemotaxis protein|nr:response regulator [Pyrinomonadaceae bacterium]